jgi:hypothetical protein
MNWLFIRRCVDPPRWVPVAGLGALFSGEGVEVRLDELRTLRTA